MKTFPIVIAMLGILLFAGFPSQAASPSVLHVSATIRPWVVFTAVQHVYSYTVTPAALQLGYVDLTGSITLDFKTNIKREIIVKFSSESGERLLFKESAGGSYFAGDYTLHPGRTVPGETISRKIDSRIILGKNTKPGNYPLHVSMSPEI